MNDPDVPLPPKPDPGPPPRNGCLTAFMVVTGILLLLPGLCAIIFTLNALGDPHIASFLPLLALCFLLAFGGLMLLRAARRRPQR